jgi:hypothetical protein
MVTGFCLRWDRAETASVAWWSEFLATDPESRVRFPALPDFLRSSGSGTGSTQPHGYKWGATWKKSSGSCLEIREYGHRDPSRWPRGTLYPHKLALTSPTSGGHSVSIVRSRAQTTEFVCFFLFETWPMCFHGPLVSSFPLNTGNHWIVHPTNWKLLYVRNIFLLYIIFLKRRRKLPVLSAVYLCTKLWNLCYVRSFSTTDNSHTWCSIITCGTCFAS